MKTSGAVGLISRSMITKAALRVIMSHELQHGWSYHDNSKKRPRGRSVALHDGSSAACGGHHCERPDDERRRKQKQLVFADPSVL
jgi:hypothetical protein